MTLTKLESGYYHATWGSEIWAQWPCGRLVQAEDFFHPGITFILTRQAECDKAQAAAEARAPEET